MTARLDIKTIDVIAPNFKRRLSGVTATIVRLVPLQAQSIGIASFGAGLPKHVPCVSLWQVLTMSRRGPSGGPRVWHARRNVEVIAGLILRWLLGKKLKLIFTSASQREHTWMTRWLIRRVDKVIATSRRGAAYLKRENTVIMHGIDLEGFAPPPDRAALKAELNLPAGLLTGCYGRVRHQKGTDVYVDAMISAINDNGLDLYGVVLGRATESHVGFERDLKKRVADAGLADRILFLGEKPVHEMAKWYQALDLFVAPQRWEGFGLTPLEAMACNVPVVATRVGAFEDIVDDGVTGALVDRDDIPSMTATLVDWASDIDRLQQAGEASRARVTESFRIQGEADAITAVYRSLL